VSADLSGYRASPTEQERINSLLRLLPAEGGSVLDVGARDGYISKQLVGRFDRVVALDLVRPEINDSRIEALQGNATNLQFPDESFDAVVCAEVLEHIPSHLLTSVARELTRVAAGRILIGVPYKQDLRLGRTTCSVCGRSNPPWGHVNSFDEVSLATLFGDLPTTGKEFVGVTKLYTNGLAAWLNEYAGNPYGTYEQQEACVHCGSEIRPPPPRRLSQRLASRLAHWAAGMHSHFKRPKPNWIHLTFDKARVSQVPREKSDGS
jgi:hypothetical protein